MIEPEAPRAGDVEAARWAQTLQDENASEQQRREFLRWLLKGDTDMKRLHLELLRIDGGVWNAISRLAQE